jgi:hypothetical protein
MMLGGLALFPKTRADGGNINMYVDPASVVAYTSSVGLGTTFNINIVLQHIDPADDLVGIEFKLYWDPTMLEGMSMVIPAGSIWAEADADGNLWKVKMLVNKTGGYCHYIVTCSSLSQGYTNGYLPLDETPSGIAATITLKIIQEPPRYGSLACALSLVDTKLANGGGGSIVHTETDGSYQFIWAPPSTHPHLSVSPTTITYNAQPIPPYTPEFDVAIRIDNLDDDWHLVGLEFKLAYNTTLLQVKSVTEGPFLQGYGETWFVTHVEYDYAYILVLFYPINLTNPTAWPQGGGVLATIKFQGIYAEQFPWTGTSPLALTDVKLSDERAQAIQYDPSIDGLYTIKGFILGRQLDVYTQYPDGFNGKGPNEPSDAFAPQDLVDLYAYLTYNQDPIQNKLVSFEVHSPYDDHIIYLTAITDTNGYAHVSFRIPWPCPAWPEDQIFGIWKVYGTADVANELVTDYMEFRVGWLVELISVQSVYPNYFKGNHTEWKVTFKTISAQYRNVTFTLVLQDELGVPVGRLTIVDYTVGGADLLGEKVYPPLDMSCLQIPKWAYIGVATAHVDAYTMFPSLGGYAYCPEVTTQVSIIRP